MAFLFGNRFVQLITVFLGLQAALFYTASHGDAKWPDKKLEYFPTELPGWHRVGLDATVDDDTRQVLKADDILSRFYARNTAPDDANLSADQRQIVLMTPEEMFIAYFATQQQGQSPHSPKNCLPAAGWTPMEAGELSIPIRGVEKPITVNKYVTAKGTTKSVVMYWYQSHGRVVADEFAAKFYLVADSMRLHRSDTALVRIVTQVRNDDVDLAVKSTIGFVQAAFPAIYKFLPQ